MTWDYLRTCTVVLAEARRDDHRRSIETCEECGAFFLTHSSDPDAEACWPCIRRERDELEREHDRSVFVRYLEGIGPGNPYLELEPEPEVQVETELLQGSLW